jgi:ribonuclease VapC
LTPAARTVLDASAILAYLLIEPGADVVRLALSGTAVVNSVNWAEVLSKMSDLGGDPQEISSRLARSGILGGALQIFDFNEQLAREVARLRPLTKSAGLSLADRACLALGSSLGAPVLTADRSWQSLRIGVKVRQIR